MKKLTNIDQLKVKERFYIVRGDNWHGYDFLCIHPNNPSYILGIDYITQDATKLYIPNLLNGETYFGDYDAKFVRQMTIKFYEKEIARLKAYDN